jgi:hypothetical protein
MHGSKKVPKEVICLHCIVLQRETFLPRLCSILADFLSGLYARLVNVFSAPKDIAFTR